MILESIRRIVIEAKTIGLDVAANGLLKLTDAQRRLIDTSGQVAAVTEESAKKQLSAESQHKRLTLSIDAQARAEANIAKGKRTLDTALQQGIITQTQYNTQLQQVKDRYAVAAEASGKYSEVIGFITTRFLALAAASAAVTGALSSVLGLAERAGALRDFADTTGFTVIELQALEKAGAQVGVSSESVTKALEKFSVSMDDAKKSTGALYEGILEVDPSLAKQLSRVKTLSQAWDIFAAATSRADITQRNTLARAAFGRSGVEITRLQASSVQAGGLSGLVGDLRAIDTITVEQAKRWDDLGDSINEFTKAAKQNLLAIFADFALETLEARAKNFLEFTRSAKDFVLSEDFKSFLDWAKTPLGAGVLGAGLGAAAGGLVGGPVGAVLGGLAGGGGGVVSGYRRESQGTATRATPFDSSNADFGISTGIPPGAAAKVDEFAAATNRLKQKQDEAKESAARLYAEQKRLVDGLGSSATAGEKYQLELLRINAEVAKNSDLESVAGRARAAAANAYNDAIGVNAILAQADALTIQGKAAGMASGEAAAFTAVETKRLEMIRKGTPLSEAELATLRKKAEVLGLVTQRNAEQTARASADFELETVFMSDLEKQIATVNRQLHGNNWREFANDGLSNTIRLTAGLKDLKDTAKGFASDLIAGLVSGKSLMESLGQAATNLSKKLTEGALESLFSGDFIGAAVKGVGAVVTGLFGASQEKRKKEKEAIAAAAERAAGFQQRIISAGIDSSTSAGQFAAFEQSAQQQRIAEAKLGGRAFVQLEQALSAERIQLARKVVEESRAILTGVTDSEIVLKIKAAQLAASDFAQAITLLGGDANEATLLLTQALAKLSSDFTEGLQSKINSATGKGYLNDIAALIKERDGLLKDAVALGLSGDKVEEYFAAQAQSIVDSSGLVGDSFTKLIDVFPALSQVVKQSAGDITRSVQQITDYLRQLNQGELSTLSPEQKLAAAGSSYSQQVGLARAGDVAATGGITQYADAYLRAAKDYYASDTNYASIFTEVNNTLKSIAIGLGTGFDVGGYTGNGSASSIAGVVHNREFVVNASGTSKYRPMLESINSGRGMTPFREPKTYNDNQVARILSDGFNGQTVAIVDAIGELSNRMKQMGDNQRLAQTQRRLPGTKAA